MATNFFLVHFTEAKRLYILAMVEKISVLIIEDETMWSDALAMNLRDFGYEVAGIASTFEDAVIALNNCVYDVVLLDITLGKRNSGLELGKMINTLYHKPYIFITAFTDNSIFKEAVSARPSAYLCKPVTPISLLATIQSAINNFQGNVVPDNMGGGDYSFFFVKAGNKYKKIGWKDVVCLRSDKKYTSLFYAADKAEYYIKSTLTHTLKYVVPVAMQAQFIQVNRAEAVNLPFITEYSGGEVKTAYKSLVVSDSYADSLRKVLRLTS